MHSRFFFFFACWLLFTRALAQVPDKDEQLASQYFANGEFEKAAVMYEKLYSKKPTDVYLYDNLLKCYINLKAFDDAEKVVKRALRKSGGTNPSFAVDFAYILKLRGKNDAFRSHCEALIKDLKPDDVYAEQLSKAFQKRGEWAYAADTYLKFRRVAKADLAFSLELSQIFAQLGKDEEVVLELLNLLTYDDSELEDVEAYLSELIETKATIADILKKALQKKSLDMPERLVFPELLIWLYSRQQQYELAFVQCRGVDKRFKLNGRRLYDFAEQVKSLELYDLASRAYEAVISLGSDKPFALSAKYGLLEVRNKKLLSGSFTKVDLLALEQAYRENIKELGINHMSANFIRDLAHLQAFYLDKHDSAILLLRELAGLPGVSPQINARAKLELGDVYLFMNEVWEATLMYEQVDYDFKEEPLGQEAKYKNAQLSYYRGDFDWSKAQLDVLKSATSQLISNNSIELLMIILDNTGLDSTDEPLQLYAAAELLIYRNKADSALNLLNLLDKKFPDHELSDEILFLRGRIAFIKKDFLSAADIFSLVWKNHEDDVLADNALIECARIYEKHLNQKEKALELYDRFITKYPGSFFITEARTRYRLLRGDALSQ